MPFGKTACATRTELLKYCFPRIPYLRKRLGYGLKLERVQFQYFTSSGIMIIYHSMQEPTISGLTATLKALQDEGTLVNDCDFGIDALAWIVSLIFLGARPHHLGTTSLLHGKSKQRIADDILRNYSNVDVDLYEQIGVKIRH